MARDERRKEDLITDATAMVNRVELVGPEISEPLVAGFRSNGALSLFFGDDPVFHFNGEGQLRRAFDAGVLYKAEAGALVRMVRNRQPGEHQLQSQKLDSTQQSVFLTDLHSRLSALATDLRTKDLEVNRQVSVAGGDVSRMLQQWLSTQVGSLSVAQSPRV